MNRINLTENEKIAQNVVGMETDALAFHMSEDNDIKNILNKEKSYKFNEQVDKYAERLDNHVKSFKETQEKLGYDITKLEIKPMGGRVLLTLFDKNPFQQVKIQNGIITDLGGLTPEFKNTDSGEIEESEQRILVGVVQEIGPDVKYVKPGDTIFVQKPSLIPIPFFKQGFWCISEQQIYAIVNESLEERFKNGRQ